MAPRGRRRRPAAAGLAFLVVGASLEQAEKYAGAPGALAYLVVGTVALLWGGPRLTRIVAALPRGHVRGLAILTGVVLAVLVVVGHPLVDVRTPGRGSDLDDELDAGAMALVHGESPYRLRTYLGNPIDLLPGELLLAVPFVLLGSSAYQALFWLPAFGAAARASLGSGGAALALCWAGLLASPVVLQQTVTGGDHVTNGIHVLVALLLLTEGWPSWPGRVQRWAGAGLLGLGLASRLSFVGLLPLVFATLGRRAGWRRATVLTTSALALAGAVTLPFYVGGTGPFPPAEQLRVLGRLDTAWPAAAVGVPAVAWTVGIGLAAWSSTGDRVRLLRDAAIVLAVPVWCGVFLHSARVGRPTFVYAAYGALALPFGLLSLWAGHAPGGSPAPGSEIRAPAGEVGSRSSRGAELEHEG